MRPRITLLKSQDQLLRKFLTAHSQSHEKAALILFRRLHNQLSELEDSDRYIAVDVIPFEEGWVTHSSPAHVHFEMKHLRDAFRRCEEEGLVLGFIHNHPTGYPEFSDTDENNERTLLDALSNRNGQDIHFVALLLTKGTWKARVRHGQAPEVSINARHVIVLGERIDMFAYDESQHNDEDISARQAAAFGRPFVDMLRSLRVGVVGCSGTGSPTITLLTRSGIGELVLFDNDHLEETNLNRVRGAKLTDVNKNKALIQQDYLNSLGLPVRVTTFQSLIDNDPAAIDALSSCDVVFGCTDDQIGRQVLNTALYVYAQVLIDVGLGGKIVEDKAGHPYLRYHHGRVSTILPEFGECLACQGVIKNKWIEYQAALRQNPDLTPEEAKERYLDGGEEPAPGVGPFTSATADFGVATLYDLLRPFRRFGENLRRDLYVIDFVQMEIRSQAPINDNNCTYCAKHEYLLLKEKRRLNRPALGKPNVYL